MNRFTALRHQAWLDGWLLLRRGNAYGVIPKPDLNALVADGYDPLATVRVAKLPFRARDLVDVARWLDRQQRRRSDMVKVPDNFDDYEKHADAFAPVPVGDYWLTLMNAKDQGEYDTKDGTGTYLNVQFTISRDPYKNRRVFEIFNIGNKSEGTRDIAWGQIYAWARACGIAKKIKDTSELVGREFKASLSIEPPNDPRYSPQNKIKTFIAPDKAGDPAAGNTIVGKGPTQHNSGAQPQAQPQQQAQSQSKAADEPPPAFDDEIPC